MQFSWYFTLAVPCAQLQATAAALAQAPAHAQAGIALSYSVNDIQVSAQLAAAQACAYTDLLADARGQAQNAAASSGTSAGTVPALSNASPAVTQYPFLAFLSPAYCPFHGSAPPSILIPFLPPPKPETSANLGSLTVSSPTTKS